MTQKIVDVHYGFSLNKYESMDEAVAGSKQSEEEQQRKKMFVDGECVQSYVFSGCSVSLALSNTRYLLISTERGRVGSKILTKCPGLSPIDNGDSVVLKYPGGALVNWNWKEHLDHICGKRISLSLSEQFHFLLVIGQKDYYCFSYAQSVSDSKTKYLTIGYA